MTMGGRGELQNHNSAVAPKVVVGYYNNLIQNDNFRGLRV